MRRLTTLFLLLCAGPAIAAPPDAEPVTESVAVSQTSSLGLQATDLTPELREWFGVKPDRGVLIGSVSADSAAATAGLRVGDVVTVLAGSKIEDASELFSTAARNAGASVPLRFVRDKREQSATIALPQSGHFAHSITIRSGSLSDLDAFDDLFRELASELDGTDIFEHLRLSPTDIDSIQREMRELERMLRGGE